MSNKIASDVTWSLSFMSFTTLNILHCLLWTLILVQLSAVIQKVWSVWLHNPQKHITEHKKVFYYHIVCTILRMYLNEILWLCPLCDFTPFDFVAADGVTLLWPWALSSYITVQRLQPLELFHGFNFLLPWLNLKLYLWKQLVYPPWTCAGS